MKEAESNITYFMSLEHFIGHNKDMLSGLRFVLAQSIAKLFM